VSKRLSPSQLAGGDAEKQGSAGGRKPDGLPLTDKVDGFMLARLAKPMYALLSPVALVDGAPIVFPVESVNCASAHAVAAVVSSLRVTLVEAERLLQGPSAAVSPMAELEPEPALPPIAMI